MTRRDGWSLARIDTSLLFKPFHRTYLIPSSKLEVI